ncbi:PIR protein [Plasmodium vivax]|uniref:VIR protein n=1 Tax=Plasmodium vivax TaxID=5855 RepID=A0A565A690_PLAVI|nr:PIR protein [Plasmodium vivax]
MGCTTEINYDTIESSDNLAVNNTQLHAQDNCITFSNSYTKSNLDIGKNICELFIKLYISLTDVKNKGQPNYEKDWHFLNYWLNINISKSKLYETTCVTRFFDGLGHHCMHTLGFVNPPSSSIYNIREEDLNKMNLLYGLYENYKKLDNILNDSQENNQDLLLEHSNKCCSYYVKANYLCNDENNKFCSELENFKTKYVGLYSKLEGKSLEYSKNFIKLTQCKDTNVISTALMGTTVGLVPLLVGLYKFTPLGQLFKPNKIKLTNEYSNNEEMRNIMLMGQESEHTSSQQWTYNIKYHSV